MTTEPYSILEHTAVLTPSKGSNTKYHCPVCDGDDLDIDPKTGAYNCFSGGCDIKDIRNAIDKLEGKPEWKPPEKFVKSARPKSQKDYLYPDRDGNPLVKVTRTDDGKGRKKFYQSHWDGSKWVGKNPDEVKKQIPIYRRADVLEAIDRNELVFIAEGESTVDLLWELGIAATTTIGGAGKFGKYGDYTADFAGGRFVLAPDRDAVGVKHVEEIAKFLGDRVTGYYLAGTQKLWNKPDGGMDIGDDIHDRQLTKEQILEKVIDPIDYQKAIATKEGTEKKTAKNSRFTSSIGGGLVKSSFDEDGTEKGNLECIGNHLEAIAVVNNPEQNQSALLLEFKTFEGHIRRVVILRSDLAGDGTAIISMLMGLGYAFKRKQKSPLLDYLHGLGIGISKKYTVTEATGWVGESFVLPHKTYGDVDLRFRDIEPSPEVITEVKGTLQGWKDNVAARCAGNSRSILALGSSFAAPLLPIVDVESGGFHLVGATSQGKTTILSIAASVTGLKAVSSWRTTDNALEGGLAASNHLCLPLDELNQADPRKVGSIVYMLGNGIGKGRSTKEGTNRKSKVWLTLVLSSGETTIGKFMELAGETIKGGQEVRLPNVPAIPENSKYGCFETIHGADTAAQFVSALDAAVKEHRGTALNAFLSRLVVDTADPTFASNLSKQVHLIAAKLCEGTKDSAIGRVAKRFALVQVSLGLAHKYDLLPFDIGQVEWGVSECFNAWLKARGGDGSIEIKNAIERIEHLLVTNEFSDRVFTLPANNDRPVRNLLAYRKLDFDGQTEEFWVPSSVFDKEFCDGVNKTELVKELQRLGWLVPPRKDGKSTHQRSIKGNAKYYFVFGKRENNGEGSEGSEGSGSNADCNDVASSLPSLHYPKITSEGSEGSPLKNDSSLHHLHHPSLDGEGNINKQNLYTASTLDLPSLPSPPSPLKTDLGNSISEESLKIGDRIKSERVRKVGTVKSIRIEKTPKGNDFTKYLVDFGFDEHWFEAVALTLEVN